MAMVRLEFKPLKELKNNNKEKIRQITVTSIVVSVASSCTDELPKSTLQDTLFTIEAAFPIPNQCQRIPEKTLHDSIKSYHLKVETLFKV